MKYLNHIYYLGALLVAAAFLALVGFWTGHLMFSTLAEMIPKSLEGLLKFAVGNSEFIALLAAGLLAGTYVALYKSPWLVLPLAIASFIAAMLMNCAERGDLNALVTMVLGLTTILLAWVAIRTAWPPQHIALAITVKAGPSE